MKQFKGVNTDDDCQLTFITRENGIISFGYFRRMR